MGERAGRRAQGGRQGNGRGVQGGRQGTSGGGGGEDSAAAMVRIHLEVDRRFHEATMALAAAMDARHDLEAAIALRARMRARMPRLGRAPSGGPAAGAAVAGQHAGDT